MKKTVLLLILIVFATVVYATCDVTDTMDKGISRTYTADGKDYEIKFDSLKNDSGDITVKFTVNGASTSDIEENSKYTFTDLSEITISNIFVGSGSVNSSAQICFNAGLTGGGGTCSTNADCDNNNPCTIDECDGDPLRCRHKLILWCRDDDGCCPESRCKPESDNDCIKIGESANKSLADNDTITGCTSGDNYCPGNCSFESDRDCDECSVDDDCSDDNACTLDSCSGAPKICSNNATPGCNFNGTCLTVGTRTEDKFCSKENILEPLRSKKEYCDNNYECLSNKCKKNKCKGPGFINWFKGLFGR